MDVTQARKLKEKENTQLKKLVADLYLDNAILKEALGKKNKFHPTGNAKLTIRLFKPWMCLNAEPAGLWNSQEQPNGTINDQ